MTVRAFLGEANTVLGGIPTPDSILDINSIAQQVNGSFESSTPSAFALAHLVAGACP
jgi:hypothetical protein